MSNPRHTLLLLVLVALSACGGRQTDDGDDSDGGSGTADGGGEAQQTIVCGEAECDALTEACCSTATGSQTTFSCIDQGGSCAGGVATCDGPEDCDGSRTCCVTFGGGALPDAACTEDAACSGSGTARACGVPEDCSGGEVCCPGVDWGLSGGFCWPGGCP